MKALNIKERAELARRIVDDPYIIKDATFGEEIVTVRSMAERTPCEIRNISERILGYIKKFGGGTYGKVYELGCDEGMCDSSNSLVLKSTLFEKSSNKNDPRAPENAEVEVLKVLQQFLREGQTPHLPLLLADFTCTFRRQHRRYIITERAVGDVKSLMRLPLFGDVTNLKVFLFQLVWTLACIHAKYPSFRHNDLSVRNILYIKGPTRGVTKYIWDESTVFYIPNIGYRFILWDFGMSSISPIVQNLNTYEPALNIAGISAHRNQSVDVSKVLHNFWFREQLERTLPKSSLRSFFSDVMNIKTFPARNNYNSFGTPLIDLETLSSEAMLHHEVFSEFRTRRDKILDVYERKSSTTYIEPLDITSEKYNITCETFPPLFIPLEDEALDIYHRRNCPLGSGKLAKTDDYFSMFKAFPPKIVGNFMISEVRKVYGVIREYIKERPPTEFFAHLTNLMGLYSFGLAILSDEYVSDVDMAAQVDYLIHISGMGIYLRKNAISVSELAKPGNYEFVREVSE